MPKVHRNINYKYYTLTYSIMESNISGAYWELDKDMNQETNQIDPIIGHKNSRDDAYKDASTNDDHQNVSFSQSGPMRMIKPKRKPFNSTIKTTEINKLHNDINTNNNEASLNTNWSTSDETITPIVYTDSSGKISNNIRSFDGEITLDRQYSEEEIDEQRRYLMMMQQNKAKVQLNPLLSKEYHDSADSKLSNPEHIRKKLNTKTSTSSSNAYLFTNAFNNLVINNSTLASHSSGLNGAMSEDDDEEDDTSSVQSNSDDMFFPFIKSTGHLQLNRIPVDILAKLASEHNIKIPQAASDIQDSKRSEFIDYYDRPEHTEIRRLTDLKMRQILAGLPSQLIPTTYVPFSTLSGIPSQGTIPLIELDDSKTLIAEVQHKHQQRYKIIVELKISAELLMDITDRINAKVPLRSATSTASMESACFTIQHKIVKASVHSIRNDDKANQIIAITRLMLNQTTNIESIMNIQTRDISLTCLNELFTTLMEKTHRNTGGKVKEMIKWLNDLSSDLNAVLHERADLQLDDIAPIISCFEEDHPITVYGGFAHQPTIFNYMGSSVAHISDHGTLFGVELHKVIIANNLYIIIPAQGNGQLLFQVELSASVETKSLDVIQSNLQEKLGRFIGASDALNPTRKANIALKIESAKNLTNICFTEERYTYFSVAGISDPLSNNNNALLSDLLTKENGALQSMSIPHHLMYVNPIRWSAIKGADVAYKRTYHTDQYEPDGHTIMIKLIEEINSTLNIHLIKINGYELVITLLTEHDANIFKRGGSEIAAFRMIGPEYATVYMRIIRQVILQNIPSVRMMYIGQYVHTYAYDNHGKLHKFRDVIISVFYPKCIDAEQIHDLHNQLQIHHSQADTTLSTRRSLANILPIQASSTIRGLSGVAFPTLQINRYNCMLVAQIMGLDMSTNPLVILEGIYMHTSINKEDVKLVFKACINKIWMFIVVLDPTSPSAGDTSLAYKFSLLGKYFNTVNEGAHAMVTISTKLPGVLTKHPLLIIRDIQIPKKIEETKSSYKLVVNKKSVNLKPSLKLKPKVTNLLDIWKVSSQSNHK